MATRVVEFSTGVYKIEKIFAQNFGATISCLEDFENTTLF
jgi:hypothetical protein